MSETRQTSVVAIVDDMFFASKIREAAKTAGIVLVVLKKTDDMIQNLLSAGPVLIIVDLNSKKLDPIHLIKEIKSAQDLKSIPTLGYLPHVEEDLKEDAIKAGFDTVLPRSRFSRELVSILESTKT